MTIKLAVLKSGEDVIADIKELISDDEKVVSYIFSNPYVVKLTQPEILVEENQIVDRKQYNISVYPWMPLTESTDIPVNPDWVVTIVEPAKNLKQSYENSVYGKSRDGNNNTNNSIIE